MGAALEVALGQPGLLQDRPDRGEVSLLGVVRGAGDGEFFVRQAEGVGGSGEDERESLKRLGRGAGVEVGFGIADTFEYVAFRIADDEAPTVDALDEHAAPHGYERGGVVHH